MTKEKKKKVSKFFCLTLYGGTLLFFLPNAVEVPQRLQTCGNIHTKSNICQTLVFFPFHAATSYVSLLQKNWEELQQCLCKKRGCTKRKGELCYVP
jgi:hypothetical protein